LTVAALAACAAFGWGYTAALITWTTRIDAARAPAGTSLLFLIPVLDQALGASVVGTLISQAGFVTAFLAAALITLASTATPLWWKSKGCSH
jgi:predicted MFS family arabinose efflux permease